jgi:hypothetical protein
MSSVVVSHKKKKDSRAIVALSHQPLVAAIYGPISVFQLVVTAGKVGRDEDV